MCNFSTNDYKGAWRKVLDKEFFYGAKNYYTLINCNDHKDYQGIYWYTARSLTLTPIQINVRKNGISQSFCSLFKFGLAD